MSALRRYLFLGMVLMVLPGCGGGNEAPPPEAQQPAPAEAPVTPAVSINAMMVDWVDHSAHAMWNVEVAGQAPRDEKGWREIERHATQLAAAGSLLTLGGTGEADAGWAQSPTWRAHARELSDVGLATFNAARNRNLVEVTTNNGRLLAVCEGCHKEFKSELPTEGRVHDPD